MNEHNAKLRILFVGRAIGTFYIFETVFETLLSRGHTITALRDPQWDNAHDAKAETVQALQNQHDTFSIESIVQSAGLRRKILFRTREIRSFRRYITQSGQSAYYTDRYAHYLPKSIKRVSKNKIARALIASPLTEVACAAIEKIIPADSHVMNHIKQLRPDVIIASPANMRFSEEIEYVKAGKKLNVKTVVPVLSWDNLTTKGLIQIKPDVLIAWNSIHAREAAQYHHIPEPSISITGAPVFDRWFENKTPSLDVHEFRTAHRLPQDAPLLLYLGSSVHIARDEAWLVKLLRHALDASEDNELRATHIIVRPHPGNSTPFAHLNVPGISVIPKQGSVPDSAEARQLFFDTAYHARATIGINTSGMIDAIVLRKPGLSYVTSRYAATQLEAQHFNLLKQSNAISLVSTPESFIAAMKKILAGQDERASERKAFITSYIRPCGIETPAGAIIADTIENTV